MSLDQAFSCHYPRLYENLDLIGLRLYVAPGTQKDPQQRRQMLQTKFFSYISYLMVSIYLEATYANIIKAQEQE
jgi:hypothetical protein